MAYTQETVKHIEKVLRETKSIQATKRQLAQESGPWNRNGPSVNTLRKIHRNMKNPPVLDIGGRPVVYGSEEKKEMARLARQYGISSMGGAIDILCASNNSELSRKRNRQIFPEPVKVSAPTIHDALKEY